MTLSAKTIAAHYDALGLSVGIINDVTSGNKDALSAVERQRLVDNNVLHLQIMVEKDYWTDQDMTAVNDAITSGSKYTAK